MALIELNNVIEGTIGPLRSAGAPSAGTNAVHTLTFAGTIGGGTFKIGINGEETAAISWSSTNATLVSNIDAALEALASVGTGGVVTAVGTMTSGVGTITLAAGGNLAKLAGVSFSIEDDSLTGSGAEVTIEETTPGVTATHRGCSIGALCTDTTNGKLYINTGTALAPTWTVVGAQS